VQFKQIKIIVAFQEPTMAQRAFFWLEDSELEHTINDNNTVAIVFDADTCAKWQNNSEKEYIKISISYVIK